MDSTSPVDYLRWLWEADYVDYKDYEERHQLQVKAVKMLMFFIVGAWKCEGCHVALSGWGHVGEFHHVYKPNMKVSEYRHNKRRESRQRALQKLWDELTTCAVLLCKNCHESVHHAPAR
jgi:ribosomal protein L32